MTKLDETMAKLRELRFATMAEHLVETKEEEKTNNRGFLWLLDHLIDLETEFRQRRAIENRFRNSKLIDKLLITVYAFSSTLLEERIDRFSCDYWSVISSSRRKTSSSSATQVQEKLDWLKPLPIKPV